MDGGECTSNNSKENEGSEYGKENESLGEHIVEEMDSFWLDIDERLTISRMVSDCVIKSMVNAFEQQAAERIAQKELEVVELKQMLHNCHVGSDKTKALCSSAPYHEPQEAAALHFSDSVIEHDKLLESVDSLQISVNEKLKQLKKEINEIRGSSSIRRTASASDLVGLSGILHENVPERWIYVDGTFESLKDTLDTFCRRMQVMDQLSKASLSERQEEQEFRSETERMVISNCMWSLQQEFEHKLLDLYDSESKNCFNQHKEISSLRQELDSIFKTLSVFETGQLISHGSLENGEEWCHNKRADHFHWKPSTNHLSPLTLEENGKQQDSQNNKSENFDSSSLKHLSRDELVTHFISEITKMKRNHESQVQEMTEENFRLRRELLNLKERGPSLPLKKDKDFDWLKKKIPTVISKLDEILAGNEKMHHFSENFESLSSLKDRLDILHLENHQLKDMLTEKKEEFKGLSSQLSAAVEKLSQQQLGEKKLLQTIQKLEDDIGDANAGVSVIQDIYKCLFEGIKSEFSCVTEELHLKNSIMEEIYEILFKETAHDAQASSGLEIEGADIESTLLQGLLDINHITFKEALVDANKALKLEAAEREEEKRKMELASEQLNTLRDETVQQQKLIAESNRELNVTKGDLVAAYKEIELRKEQINKLHQNLEQRLNELRESDEKRRALHLVTQKKQDALTLIEAKERETRRQMESTIDLIHKLCTMVTDFEARVNEDISRNCLRYAVIVLRPFFSN